MSASKTFDYRRAVADDYCCLSILATQVFLDTYATSGINADLAHEAIEIYSPRAFADRLAHPKVEITVAESRGNMVGFVDLSLDTTCPVPAVLGPEVLRLYVQAPFQRRGLGRSLMKVAESRALTSGAAHLWLTAWSGNAGALAFYPTIGYTDVGVTQYVIAGRNYENRVYAKQFTNSAA